MKSYIHAGPRTSSAAAVNPPHIADVTNVDVTGPVAVEVDSAIKARFTVSYTAPANLGDGELKFTGVKLFVTEPDAVIEGDVQVFAGNGGDDVSFTVDLKYPSSEQTWTFALASRSDKYQNPLAASTPNKQVTVPADPLKGAAPDVLLFNAGTLNPDATWTHSPRWDTLNERMLIDWGCQLPDDTTNWSQVVIFIHTPSGDYVQATGPITKDDFTGADVGPVHYDTIAVSGADLPASPESWTIIACSYTRAGLPNQDVNQKPAGPSVPITTLTPKEKPNFDAPGPVQNADFQTEITGPNDLLITAMYDFPATGGPMLGCQIILQRPGLADEDLGIVDATGTGRQYLIQHHVTPSAPENWTLKFCPYGKNHAGDPANAVTVTKQVLPYPPATQIGAGVTAVVGYSTDDAGNPTYNFSGTFPIPNDPQFDFCRIKAVFDGDPREIWLADEPGGTFNTGYFPIVPVDQGVTIKFYSVNKAGQVNASNPPSVYLTVKHTGGATTGPGTERAPLVAAFSANVGYVRDEGGSWRYYLYGSWTNPTGDNRYQGVKIYYLPAGGAYPILLAVETAGSTRFQTDSWPAPANETGIVYALSIDANNRTNTYVSGTTPQVSVTINPGVGGAGQERAPVVGSVTAAVFYDYSEVGAQRFIVNGSFAEPADKSAYRGCRIVLRPSGGNGSTDVELAVCALGTTSYTSPHIAVPSSTTNYTVLFFSLDANNRANTYVNGVTPAVAVTVAPSAFGNLQPSRFVSGSLGKGLSIAGNQIYIPSQAIDNTLLGLQSVFGPNLWNGAVISQQHLNDFIVSQQKLQNAQIIDMARIVDGNITKVKIGLGVIDYTLIATAGIRDANILTLGAQKIDVTGGSISTTSGALTLSGANGVSITNGGNLNITPGFIVGVGASFKSAGLGWDIQPGLNSYISGPGYVNANAGFKVNGAAGLTTSIGVVDSGGTAHVLYFTGGILTGIG